MRWITLVTASAVAAGRSVLYEQRRAERKLAMTVEDRRTWSSPHRPFTNVADNADDRRVRVLILHAYTERFAKRVHAPKISVDERLVDHESGRRIRIVGMREFASSKHGNTQRLEIPRCDDADSGARPLRARSHRGRETMKRRAGPRSADHRQSVCACCRIHSGQRANRRQKFLLKRDLALDGIARAWQRDLHCQEALLLKAVVHAGECDHRSHEQRSPAEQHDGHGHLSDDKQPGGCAANA